MQCSYIHTTVHAIYCHYNVVCPSHRAVLYTIDYEQHRQLEQPKTTTDRPRSRRGPAAAKINTNSCTAPSIHCVRACGATWRMRYNESIASKVETVGIVSHPFPKPCSSWRWQYISYCHALQKHRYIV
jgi:hypothetical protein